MQGAARNVTCRWPSAGRCTLALAGSRSGALDAARERAAPLRLPRRRRRAATGSERRFQELAHTERGAGPLARRHRGRRERRSSYGVASRRLRGRGRLPRGHAGSCEMKIAGGGVYRVVGRQPPKLDPRTPRRGRRRGVGRPRRLHPERRRSRRTAGRSPAQTRRSRCVDASNGHRSSQHDARRARRSRSRSRRTCSRRSSRRRSACDSPGTTPRPATARLGRGAVGDEPASSR